MSLVGKNVEEQMWNFFMDRVGNAYGVAALMGHWFAESGLNPKNLQDSFEKRLLGYTDESYTMAVDNGSYTNFVHDSAGYGLAQWTYWSRKQNLLEFAKKKKCSIGDTEMQFEFGYQELCTGYKSVLAVMKTAKSVREASDVLLTQYEKPADQSESVKVKRAGYGQKYYEKYAGAVSQSGDSKMSNSSLVTCTMLSPNKNSPRNHKIDTITPHCVVGQWTAEKIGEHFSHKEINASCTYGIGYDGRRVLVVDENDRSWCSSSKENDNRAITIECASDKTAPYAMNSAVYESLIELCADICRRNGKTKLLWLGSKERTLAYQPKSNEMVLTAHRWFANKPCPGDWLYSRYGDLAERVNRLLGSADSTSSTVSSASAVATKEQTYVVKKGDTLSKIASKYGTTYRQLASYNGISNPNVIKVGQVIRIPGTHTRTYTVKAGDSLWAIAEKQLGDGKRYKEIKTLNGLTSDTIRAGQVLELPA